MFIISLFFVYVLYLVFIVSSPLENNISTQDQDNQSTFKAIVAFLTLCTVYFVYYLLFIVEVLILNSIYYNAIYSIILHLL